MANVQTLGLKYILPHNNWTPKLSLMEYIVSQTFRTHLDQITENISEASSRLLRQETINFTLHQMTVLKFIFNQLHSRPIKQLW